MVIVGDILRMVGIRLHGLAHGKAVKVGQFLPEAVNLDDFRIDRGLKIFENQNESLAGSGGRFNRGTRMATFTLPAREVLDLLDGFECAVAVLTYSVLVWVCKIL